MKIQQPYMLLDIATSLFVCVCFSLYLSFDLEVVESSHAHVLPVLHMEKVVSVDWALDKCDVTSRNRNSSALVLWACGGNT